MKESYTPRSRQTFLQCHTSCLLTFAKLNHSHSVLPSSDVQTRLKIVGSSIKGIRKLRYSEKCAPPLSAMLVKPVVSAFPYLLQDVFDFFYHLYSTETAQTIKISMTDYQTAIPILMTKAFEQPFLQC